MKIKKGDRFKVKSIPKEEEDIITMRTYRWVDAIGHEFTMLHDSDFGSCITSQDTTLERRGIVYCQNIPIKALVRIKKRK
jgi:hypothetical protein